MTDTNGLASALAELQTQLPKIRKSERANTGTYTYTYADLAGISEQLLPIMGRLGLSFTTWPTLNESGGFVLRYKLLHTSGESDGGEYPLPTGTPQAIGSAITYGRRYCLCAVTGIAPEDDDGAAASHAQTPPPPPPAKKTAARKPSAHSPAGNRPAGDDLTIEKDKGKLAALHIRLGEYGIGGADNRDAALAYMADVIGHDLDTSKALTVAEFRKVMDRLAYELGQGKDVDPQQTPPEPDGDDPWGS